MRSPRRSRAGRILAATLVVFLTVSVAQALVNAQAGALAGILLVAGFGIACFRAGRRHTHAQDTQAQTARPPTSRRHPLSARIARDAARLLLSRR